PHNSKCGDAQEFFRQTIQRIRSVASQLRQGTAPVKDFRDDELQATQTEKTQADSRLMLQP
ncbi:MAG: hypothetical protein ACI4T6_09300, partial [Candidatus Flemingiibacterium sp.]